jgi:hypothetical protein
MGSQIKQELPLPGACACGVESEPKLSGSVALQSGQYRKIGWQGG